MYKIGIIGSGPERFGDRKEVKRSIAQTIEVLGSQYGRDQLVFNIRADVGVGLWAAQRCLEDEFRYSLFLPFSLQKTSEHWFESQRQTLANQYLRAHSLIISQPDLKKDKKDDSYDLLIDDSNFLVCFWDGAKHSCVYDAIKTALSHNRMVLDGFNDLKLMTNKDIRKTKVWKSE